jgi:GT2 family glycosyltransferase
MSDIVITAIVPTYNEVRHIGACLDGLLHQEGIAGDIEILVIDGMSTDGTATFVRTTPEHGTKIRVLENPRRLQVYAWNIGMREARGEYIAFIGAHAEYSRGYFRSCLDVMQRTGATVVGGVQRPYGHSAIGRAIAWCMQSPFGIGNARFRYAQREEEAESVFGAFMRRETLAEAGGVDERLPFDEDDELNYRIRHRGGKIVVSPAIGVRYHVRESLKPLAMQMFRYGYWRRFAQLLHPRDVPLRVYVPPAFVAAFVLSLALAITPLRAVSLAVPVLYAAFVAFAMAVALARMRSTAALLVPLALATMHVCYGVGWWKGLAKFRSIANGKDGRALAR